MIYKNLLSTLKDIILLEKTTFIFFIILTIFMTFIELLNIYFISAFLSFMMADEIKTVTLLNSFEINSLKFISVLTISIIIIRSISSFLIKSFEFFYINRLLAKASYNYFKNILNLDYNLILKFKPSKISNTLLHEIVNIIQCIFNPIIIIFLEILVSITLIIYALLNVDTVFIFIAIGLLILYLIFFLLINPINTLFGKKRFELEQLRLNLINDNVRGIRHLKFASSSFLGDLLSKTLLDYGIITSKKKIITASSKYLLELIVYVGFFLIIIVTSYYNEGYLSNSIALAIIAFRLIPSFNRIITESFLVKFNLPILSNIKKINILNQNDLKQNYKSTKKINTLFKKFIKLEKINFGYENEKKQIFNNFSLLIKKNEITAITGKSGLGKSTLVNICCALLRVKSGKIYLDENELKDGLFDKWRNMISLFSQDSFLFHGSIKDNIIMGEKYNKIKLKKICNNIGILEFISFSNLDNVLDPYKTNLSGGQIQRILIARTLYKESQLYIFDEPTTNLDQSNKDKFMNYLKKLNTTSLIVTHDKEILNYCDRVHSL